MANVNFGGNELLKGSGVQIEYTPKQIEEYQKCMNDPVYFAKTYITIVNLDKGRMKFNMYDFQEKMITQFVENRFNICKLPRQVGKTTTCVSYMLWLTLFHNDKKIAVLANKADLARDILANYQTAYEDLPMWLQQGVRVWNKGRIILENGSSITAAATTSNAIRGSSFNCVTGETYVTICIEDEIYHTTIEELYNLYISTHPKNIKVLTPNGFKSFYGVKKSSKPQNILTITTKLSSIRCTEEHKLLNSNNEFMLANSLDVGDELKNVGEILQISKKESDEYVYDLLNVDGGHQYFTNNFISHNCVVLDEFAFVSNNIADEFMASVLPTISSSEEAQIIIISTPKGMNHYYRIWNDAKQGANAYVPFEAHWSEVPGRDENWAREQLKLLGQVKYEQEVECRFLGSSNTLLEGRTLQNMKYKAPLEKKKIFNNQFLDIFEYPKKGGDGKLDVASGRIITDSNYVACVDVAEGLGMDYSVITIIDVTTLPYKVVAKYRSNTIQPIVLPAVIVEVCKYYNNAWCLIEINQQPQVAESVFKDFHYEKMIKVTNTGNGLNQYMTLETDKKTRYGIKTSHTTKRMGCNALKDLIESGKLVHFDFDLYQEFTTFIRINNSFGADDGYHDDIVMSLVLFGWMTTQEKFKDITNHDLRKQFQKDELSYIENEDKSIPKPNDKIPVNLVDKAFVADNTLWLLSSGDMDLNSQYSSFLDEFIF